MRKKINEDYLLREGWGNVPNTEHTYVQLSKIKANQPKDSSLGEQISLDPTFEV